MENSPLRLIMAISIALAVLGAAVVLASGNASTLATSLIFGVVASLIAMGHNRRGRSPRAVFSRTRLALLWAFVLVVVGILAFGTIASSPSDGEFIWGMVMVAVVVIIGIGLTVVARASARTAEDS